MSAKNELVENETEHSRSLCCCTNWIVNLIMNLLMIWFLELVRTLQAMKIKKRKYILYYIFISKKKKLCFRWSSAIFVDIRSGFVCVKWHFVLIIPLPVSYSWKLGHQNRISTSKTKSTIYLYVHESLDRREHTTRNNMRFVSHAHYIKRFGASEGSLTLS